MRGIPRVLYFGQCGSINCLVMELLGPNLEDLFQFCGGRFSLKTTLMIAFQILDRLELIHSAGFIYRLSMLCTQIQCIIHAFAGISSLRTSWLVSPQVLTSTWFTWWTLVLPPLTLTPGEITTSSLMPRSWPAQQGKIRGFDWAFYF